MGIVGAVALKSKSSSWRSHALIACIAVLGLLLAGASWSATESASERERAEASRAHATEVLQTANHIELAAFDAIRSSRGFLISDDPDFLRPLAAAEPRGRKLIARLRTLVANDPQQAALARNIEVKFEGLIGMLNSIVADHRTGKLERAIERVKSGEGENGLELITADLHLVTTHEDNLYRQRSAVAADRARANQVYQYALTIFGLTLMFLASFAAVSVRRAIAAEADIRSELERRAMTDELTGLANRREFMASLERSIAASRRNHRPVSLAILDIDHFKRVNDTFGHPAGDAVIRTVATTAVDIMRGQDTVGRLGGEEFAVVLPDCSGDNAFAACERLRIAMRDADLELETGQNISITLSVGIAMFEPDDTAESMIARADAALYSAKNCGRDKVQLAA